ncbi:MAG: hypothetical protein K2M30_04660 [Desulfovibrionaceae bacterium]|nr:hypothetical protein [Desulfovibrionaceae bacterium]
MRNKLSKQRTRYLIIGMIALALFAFIIFYVFLIDIFMIFTTQEQSLGSLPLKDDTQEVILSPFELDAESSISPVHGENPLKDVYPIEEIHVLARSLAHWFSLWYTTHSTEPFPVEQFATKIQDMHFSEGNSTPSIEEIPQLLIYAFPLFVDALFIEPNASLSSQKELASYMVTFTRQASAVLDCIRTIPSLQHKEVTEMIRVTQHVASIERELTSLNADIQKHIESKESTLLPALAEKKFTLQRTKEEQELILEQYNARFSSFYARAQIRNLPSSLVHTIVSTFMQYAPQEQWNRYASSLLLFVDKCTTTLEQIALEEENV